MYKPPVLGDGRDLAERTTIMAARYVAGETMTAIGLDYCLSRERVRQILRKAGVPVMPVAPHRSRNVPFDASDARWWAAGRRRGYAQSRHHDAKRKAKRRELRDALVRLAKRLGRTPTQDELGTEIGLAVGTCARYTAHHWHGRPGTSVRRGKGYWSDSMRRMYRAAGLRPWPPGRSGPRPIENRPDPTPPEWWETH